MNFLTQKRTGSLQQWTILLRFFLFSIIGLAVSLPVFSADNNGPTQLALSWEDKIPKLMQTYQIPGACIVVIQDGSIAWAKAFGYADLEEERPMTLDTPFRVQSISKSLTAYGVMKLVEQEKLALDDPAAQYLDDWVFPDSPYNTDAITIRHLLTQTSGLPQGTVGIHFAPTEARPTLRENLTHEAIAFQEAGQSFRYSNVGFNLLELVIENITNMPFSTYMEKEVLLPLHMNHASFEWQDSFQKTLPLGYDLTGKPVSAYVYPEKASGGLFATAEEVAQYVIATADSNQSSLIHSDSLAQMLAPSVEIPGLYGFVANNYGFGHFVEILPNGDEAVFHGGQGHGWMTHFHSIPSTGDGIVILTNSQRSWPVISTLLIDWAKWNGYSNIGMGLISKTQKGVWGLTVLIGLLASLLLLQAIRQLRNSKGNPILQSTRKAIFEFSIGLILLAVLLWCALQDYLMITSIYPVAALWLGRSTFIFAIILILKNLLQIRRYRTYKSLSRLKQDK